MSEERIDVKVGICLGTLYPWQLNEMAVGLAETVKADSLWVPDHMLANFHPALWSSVGISDILEDPDALFDPFCVAAAAGRMTEIPFGVAVTDGIRRGPADVARSALTLQHLCKGGFNLGLGSGEAENLVPFGYPFDRPVGRLEEFLQTLTALLRTGRMPSGPGRLGLPQQSAAGPVKLWLAGHRPRMLRLTGQYADGWLPAFPMTPEEYGARKAQIARHAAAWGRPEPESGLFAFIVLGENRERIREMFDTQPVAKLMALTAPAGSWQKHGFEHPCGSDNQGFVDVIVHGLDPEMLRTLAPNVPFDVLDELLFTGSVAEVVTRLRPYIEHGCQHIVLWNMTGIVGGLQEAQTRLEDLFRLRSALDTLQPNAS